MTSHLALMKAEYSRLKAIWQHYRKAHKDTKAEWIRAQMYALERCGVNDPEPEQSEIADYQKLHREMSKTLEERNEEIARLKLYIAARPSVFSGI